MFHRRAQTSIGIALAKRRHPLEQFSLRLKGSRVPEAV